MKRIATTLTLLLLVVATVSAQTTNQNEILIGQESSIRGNGTSQSVSQSGDSILIYSPTSNYQKRQQFPVGTAAPQLPFQTPSLPFATQNGLGHHLRYHRIINFEDPNETESIRLAFGKRKDLFKIIFIPKSKFHKARGIKTSGKILTKEKRKTNQLLYSIRLDEAITNINRNTHTYFQPVGKLGLTGTTKGNSSDAETLIKYAEKEASTLDIDIVVFSYSSLNPVQTAKAKSLVGSVSITGTQAGSVGGLGMTSGQVEQIGRPKLTAYFYQLKREIPNLEEFLYMPGSKALTALLTEPREQEIQKQTVAKQTQQKIPIVISEKLKRIAAGQ
jgi:hypothetical protein